MLASDKTMDMAVLVPNCISNTASTLSVQFAHQESLHVVVRSKVGHIFSGCLGDTSHIDVAVVTWSTDCVAAVVVTMRVPGRLNACHAV